MTFGHLAPLNVLNSQEILIFTFSFLILVVLIRQGFCERLCSSRSRKSLLTLSAAWCISRQSQTKLECWMASEGSHQWTVESRLSSRARWRSRDAKETGTIQHYCAHVRQCKLADDSLVKGVTVAIYSGNWRLSVLESELYISRRWPDVIKSLSLDKSKRLWQLNDWLSLGQHRVWKRMAVSWAGYACFLHEQFLLRIPVFWLASIKLAMCRPVQAIYVLRWKPRIGFVHAGENLSN